MYKNIKTHLLINQKGNDRFVEHAEALSQELLDHLEFLKQCNRYFNILEARISRRKKKSSDPVRRVYWKQQDLFLSVKK